MKVFYRITQGIVVVLVMLLGYGLFIYNIGGFGVRATNALIDLYTEHPEMVAWP